MAESGDAKDKEKEKSGGKGGFVVAMLILAVLGAGAGAGFSLTVLNGDSHRDAGKPGASAKHDAHAAAVPGKTGSGAKGGEGEVAKELVMNLEPILVTLAGPQKSWARVELALVVEAAGKEDNAVLLKSMTENLMSFMRTVPLAHVESAAGLEYLREDLTEIVRARSKGRARGVVLRSLVVE